MTWFRVEDPSRGQVALIEAEASHEAIEKYIEDYASEYFVEEASEAEVEDWKSDIEEWDKDDTAHLWHR